LTVRKEPKALAKQIPEIGFALYHHLMSPSTGRFLQEWQETFTHQYLNRVRSMKIPVKVLLPVLNRFELSPDDLHIRIYRISKHTPDAEHYHPAPVTEFCGLLESMHGFPDPTGAYMYNSGEWHELHADSEDHFLIANPHHEHGFRTYKKGQAFILKVCNVPDAPHVHVESTPSFESLFASEHLTGFYSDSETANA
jgi:hypothetical protein